MITMKNTFKGNVSLMEGAMMALAFVLFIVVVSIGGSILTGVQTGQAKIYANGSTAEAYNQSIAWNVSAQGLQGNNNLAVQASTMGTILGAAILIGLLLSAFMFRKE